MIPFLANLSVTLELDAVAPDQVLEDLPEWDSLMALSVIAMIDGKYRVNLNAEDLRGGLTAKGLFDLVQARRP